ncbi:hypothetical protein J008_02966 [Cryptococcus neoformans]|nr:hypothetical protein C367_02891 [Cryptococcus neoformans var. grubii Ze90-1]OXH33671.1 hypothetical protein J008_02966 [Cryptococcus neoformans var. grubii]
MNRAEFTNLVALFGGHEVFKSQGRSIRRHQTHRTLFEQYIFWPSGVERAVLARELYAQYGIPSCIGFIDGTDIVLRQAPSIGCEKAHTVHSYKEEYGYKLMAVMAQDLSDLHRNPHRFFSPKEYVLGDAGVKSSDTVLPLFKRERRTQVTVGPKAYFNHKCAKARVMIAQAFGTLKNRWQQTRKVNRRGSGKALKRAFGMVQLWSECVCCANGMESTGTLSSDSIGDIGLQDCRLTCRTVTDEARLYLVIQACMVLHNLLVETWKDSLTTSEVAGVMNIDERAAGVGDQVANRRRDEVVAEMIRDEVHRDPAFDVSTFEM